MDSRPASTIPELVDTAPARFGDAEALVDGDVRWNWTELVERIHTAARAVMASGVGPGDRVAIWAPNIAEWVVAALGVHAAGGVLVPVNTRFKGHEAADLVARSGARVLFTVTGFLDTDYVALLDAAGRPDCLGTVVVLRGDPGENTVPFDEWLGRADGVDEADREARSAAVTADDLCHVMFTSGTTGRPKGAMLTHGAVCRAYRCWAEVIGLDRTDRYLIVNPFFHSFGLNAGILACFTTGATMVPHAVFDVPSVIRRVGEERISMLPGPPAIYQTILDHPDLESLDLSSLRLAVTGAAAIPVQMIRRMYDRLGFETVVTGYGLTEASGIATMCRHDDDPETIATTSGRAIDGVEVRVVDPTGTEVPRGQPGEIVVRGYNVMVGYLDDPEATAEAIDDEGWLHTGDIGVMDERGYVDITDRLKDMFIVGGFNAYPAEIEAMLLEHPDIARVAVVGVPDERLGEVGWAFVVPAVGHRVDAEAVVAWCRGRMANYKVPRRVVIVGELPLNASGKVLKYRLRERALDLLRQP